MYKRQGIVYDDAAIEGGWDNLSPEEIAERLNQKVEEGMINISMNTAPYFENLSLIHILKKAIVITLGVIIGVAGVLAICAHLADSARLALYVPEDDDDEDIY